METDLQYCLFCSNGGMSSDEKTVLLHEFVKSYRQKLFHMDHFLQKQEIFDFIAKTSDGSVLDRPRKDERSSKKRRQQQESSMGLITFPDSKDMVFAETK